MGQYGLGRFMVSYNLLLFAHPGCGVLLPGAEVAVGFCWGLSGSGGDAAFALAISDFLGLRTRHVRPLLYVTRIVAGSGAPAGWRRVGSLVLPHSLSLSLRMTDGGVHMKACMTSDEHHI